MEDLKEMDLKTIDPEYLVKPTGAIQAPLASVWHYPTFKTKRGEYGHVLDRTNPSMRLHNDKVGFNEWVRTHDLILIKNRFVSEQVGGVPWGSLFEDWPKMLARLHGFSAELVQRSRVLVFVGQHNCLDWQTHFPLAADERLTKVLFKSTIEGLRVAMPSRVYREAPGFFIIKGPDGVIRRLFFLFYHSQYLMQCDDYKRCAYTDFMWNAAAAFAGLDVAKYDAYVKYTSAKAPKISVPRTSVPKQRARWRVRRRAPAQPRIVSATPMA